MSYELLVNLVKKTTINMAKRFSKLKYALETLRTPNSTTATPDAPAGTIARKYQDYKAGKVQLTYPRSEGSKPESILKVSIMPFYFGGAVGSEAIVAQSQRADEESTLAGIQTACNQITTDPELHARLAKFKPAKVTIFNFGATSTTETSQITGVKYSKKAGASYTFPYGANATEKTDSAVRKDILAAVKTLGTASASFSSEKY